MLGIGLGLSNITGGIGNIISRILSALKGRAEYFENKEGTVDIIKPLKERELLDKASIVLTPTAYSDGFIHTAVPQYKVLPTELVTNSDFNSTSNWTASTEVSSFTVSDGIATIQGTANSFNNRISQSNIPIEVGKKYEIKIRIKSNDGGSWLLRTFDSVNLYLNIALSNNTEFNTYTYYYTAKTTIFTINLASYYTSGTADMSVDFISIKEIQEADFDFVRATTATRVNELGLIEEVAAGIPRIDYSSGVGQWLFEPARTNLLNYTEDFSNGVWGGIASFGSLASVTTNQSISPDGLLTADLITGTGTVGSQSRRMRASSVVSPIVPNAYYTFSVFIKKSATSIITYHLDAAGALADQQAKWGVNNIYPSLSYNFDTDELTNNTLDAVVSRQKLSNGWVRVCISLKALANGNNQVIPGWIGKSGDTHYVWGASFEVASYPTSYIPNTGATATKTRNADVANNSGNADLFNDSEGVLYAEIAALANDGTYREITISDGTNSNWIEFRFQNANVITGQIRKASVDYVTLNYTTTNLLNLHKIAFKYKVDDVALWVNGIEVSADVIVPSTQLPTGLNKLNFDRGDGGNIFYGNTKELMYFPEALTDEELETLSSWSTFELMAADLEYTI